MKQHYENGGFINSPTVIVANKENVYVQNVSIVANVKNFNGAPIVRLDGRQLNVNYIQYVHDENTDKTRLKIIYFDNNGTMQTLTIESPYELNGEN